MGLGEGEGQLRTRLLTQHPSPPAVTYPPPSGPGTPTWFSEPFNVSLGTLQRLDALLHESGFSFALDLSELYGRTCNHTRNNTDSSDPGDTPGQWCEGPWDSSNLRALLQRIHDDGTIGSNASSLFAFELGNELSSHISVATNLGDIAGAAALLREIWADVPSPPPLYAPAISSCGSEGGVQILEALPDIRGVSGFSYHSYPAGGGEDLSALILDPAWLRNGVIGETPACLLAWNQAGGPRDRGLGLWVTEAASSYNWAVPPPAQDSFLDSFFTLAQFGQYASTGVGIVARWSYNEPNAFATIWQNATRWDVAADFWIMVAMRALLDRGVLAVTSDANATAAIVAYAQCTLAGAVRRGPPSGVSGEIDDEFHWRWDLSRVVHPLVGTHPPTNTAAALLPAAAGNGSIVLFAANPRNFAVNLSLTEAVSADTPSRPLQTTPRLDWVFSSPGGPADLGALSPVLNAFDHGGTLLRLADDGSLPPMRGFYVPAGGAETVSLPPRSLLFSVLLHAEAPACTG